MLTNPHIGEGVLAPNEVPRFDQIPAETHQAVRRMVRYNRWADVEIVRYIGDDHFELVPTIQRREQVRTCDALDWYDRLLSGDPE